DLAWKSPCLLVSLSPCLLVSLSPCLGPKRGERCSVFESQPEDQGGPGGPGEPLLVFADDWGRHPSSCQHLARHLLARHRVVWVNTIGTRPPRLDRATLARGLEKLRHWAGRPPSSAPGSDPPGLCVLSPTMW